MKQFPLKMKCRKPVVLTVRQGNSWYSHLLLAPAHGTKEQENQDDKDRKMPKTLHCLSQVSNAFQFFP